MTAITITVDDVAPGMAAQVSTITIAEDGTETVGLRIPLPSSAESFWALVTSGQSFRIDAVPWPPIETVATPDAVISTGNRQPTSPLPPVDPNAGITTST